MSLPLWSKIERKQLLIDSFFKKVTVKQEQMWEKRVEPPQSQYIKEEIITGFAIKEGPYNYKKLLGLMRELNDNYSKNNAYTSAILIRAILDHIPPLLGFSSFGEVANNRSWGETDKKYVLSLLGFKSEGDDALHRVISSDPDLLDIADLPNPIRVNRLLQECLKGGKDLIKFKQTINTKSQLKTPPTQTPKGIDVSMMSNDIRWANWGMRHLVWSSFRVRLKIDNYKNELPDYINVQLQGELESGDIWNGKHFIFENVDGQDEELRLEAHEVRNATVFISDSIATTERATKPVFKEGSFKLIVSTKSGLRAEIPLENEWITKD